MNFLKVSLLSFILISGNSFSQEVPKEHKEAVKHDAFKLSEVILKDSTAASELMKRAVNWVKADSPRFTKTNGITTGTKAECIAVFKVKPKELNPVCDFTGTITMHVSIECKENRYRYTIGKIEHVSANGKNSGGDINNVVPECGSMTMPANEWKKIKGEGKRGSEAVVSELIEGMDLRSTSGKKDDW